MPGVLAPTLPGRGEIVVDNHALPRLLVCAAGACTSGLAGVLAFVMLALADTHRTGTLYMVISGIALFTAVAELLTVASISTDRKMVTGLGWAVAPGHAAGISVTGYLLHTIGAPPAVSIGVAALIACGTIYAARAGSLRVFERSERDRLAQSGVPSD